MSKVVTIPKDRNPFIVIVNGVEYKYPAGATIEVPDSVADVIEKYEGAKPKPDPNPAPGGNSGGSVQTDWEQKSETAPDFLKNKPFYDNREETVLIEEGEYAPDPDAGMVLFSEEAVDISLGTVYEVYWDNRVVYQLLPIIQDGSIALGDMNLEAYPFCIISADSFGTIGVFNDGMSHKVKITAKTGDVKKLDASLISAEWSATVLKNEDIIIPLASRDFTNGEVEVPYEQSFSEFDGLQNRPTAIKIIWNGVEYSDQMILIFAGTSDGVITNYFFQIDGIEFKIKYNNIISVSADCETATFSFSIVNKTPVKMPADYLPNVPAEKFVLASPSGKQFVIAVDDSGTLTTTEVTA